MIAKVFKWDQPRNVKNFLSEIKAGDTVIVKHDWGIFSAEVLLVDKSLEGEVTVGTVLRKANSVDHRQILGSKKIEKDLTSLIKREVREANLPMKISSVSISLDNSCLVVAFTAEGRVDFREMVKNLSEKLGKSIRFQQIGSRDEARRIGGFGICGREICCVKFKGALKGITTEMARSQLIYHRGSERISGICGRLMCCLQFEADQYQEVIQKMPEKGSIVFFQGKKGKVIDWNILKEKVKVELEGDNSIVEIEIDKIRKEEQEKK